tara:strand:+ start:857 stop:1333 length:477 start_codon:yes stop_codon:yes gene_type:complete
MATTTFGGIVRSYGGGGKGTVTPGVMTQSVQVSCDPTASSSANVKIGTSSSSGEDLVLPAGAIVISVMTMNASTGGTNPTIDIGGTPAGGSNDPDGIFNEVDCDTIGTIKGADGALCVAGGLTANTTVTAINGSSAATGGTWTGIITYAMANDGVESN